MNGWTTSPVNALRKVEWDEAARVEEILAELIEAYSKPERHESVGRLEASALTTHA